MSTMPVTLRTTTTVFLLCGICALDVSKASNLPVAYKQYVTMNGRKLDGEAVLTLCTMKKLLDGIADRADFLERQSWKYLKVAREIFQKVSEHGDMKAALGQKMLDQMRGVQRVANRTKRSVEETWEKAKRAAANSSKVLKELLKWHCINKGAIRDSFDHMANANCDPSAYKHDYHRNFGHDDARAYAIYCEYKSIPAAKTDVTFSNMEGAVEAWNRAKPKADARDAVECSSGHSSRSASSSDKPCTLLESWRWDYDAARYAILKLETLVRNSLVVTHYAQRFQQIGRESLAQYLEWKKAAEARAAEEEAKRQAAEKAAEEARKALEEAEERRVAAEEQAEARRLEAEKAEKAKEAGQPVSEEKKKMLLEAVEKAEATEKAAEKQAKDSRKAFEEAEEERIKATEDAEVARWDKEGAEESEEKLKKDVEKLAEELKEESKESGEEDDVNADHDDEGSEAKSGWIGTTKVLIFLIPLLLLLLGLLVFFVIRGRRKAEVKDDISIGEANAKSKNTKTAAGFDSDI
uniref:ISG75 n=1 Tax=Trypanosoma brucei rhodesiense TaxID=31286 RepID=Q1WKC7_TRYBR|nr:ISG75 [Trypanosoma brucei rhodesiense]